MTCRVKNPLDESVYTERTTFREEDIRGPYFRDQTAIIHSLPFRRLKHKTQFFFSPTNDHICTRIEHVIHVATIAATICKGLSSHGWELNSELAYAIGLGHDLGHAPFGHAGEEALNECMKEYYCEFIHEVNSYRVVEHLADYGKGLDLTYAVKDGIINHNGEKFEQSLKPSAVKNDLENIRSRTFIPSSYEGCIVRFSDKIAYLGRDLEDAVSAGLIKESDIPQDIKDSLGHSNSDIINTMVLDFIKSTINAGKLTFSDEIFASVRKMKRFNYERIYNHPLLVDYKNLCQKAVKQLFSHFIELYYMYKFDFDRYNESPFLIDRHFGRYLKSLAGFYNSENNVSHKIVADYISGMTDSYAIEAFSEITIPRPIVCK